MSRYEYHGFAIESPLPLDLPRRAANGPPDLVIRAQPALPEIEGVALWSSRITDYHLHARGRERFWLVNDGGGFVATLDEVLVAPDPPGPERMEYLFTSVLAVWLHRSARPPLHAAAIRVGSGAIGLMARSGGGKSTLAAALVSRGARMLCDDVLPLHFDRGVVAVADGRRHARLWPDSARLFSADVDALPRVMPATEKRRLTLDAEGPAEDARGTPPPLKAIYHLERAGDPESAIAIEPLSRTDALVALLGNGQMSQAAEALGLGPSRLEILAQVARDIPVRRFRFPTAFDRLPEVCEALEADAG